MKKFRAILWGLIIIVLVLVFFQNRAFFEAKQSLMLDLYITDAFHSMELYTAVWFLAALVVGFLLAYFFGLVEKFKSSKLLKGLKAELQAKEAMIAQLKEALSSSPGFHRNGVTDDDAVDISSASLPKTTEISPDQQ